MKRAKQMTIERAKIENQEKVFVTHIPDPLFCPTPATIFLTREKFVPWLRLGRQGRLLIENIFVMTFILAPKKWNLLAKEEVENENLQMKKLQNSSSFYFVLYYKTHKLSKEIFWIPIVEKSRTICVCYLSEINSTSIHRLYIRRKWKVKN